MSDTNGDYFSVCRFCREFLFICRLKVPILVRFVFRQRTACHGNAVGNVAFGIGDSSLITVYLTADLVASVVFRMQLPALGCTVVSLLQRDRSFFCIGRCHACAKAFIQHRTQLHISVLKIYDLPFLIGPFVQVIHLKDCSGCRFRPFHVQIVSGYLFSEIIHSSRNDRSNRCTAVDPHGGGLSFCIVIQRIAYPFTVDRPGQVVFVVVAILKSRSVHLSQPGQHPPFV